MSFVKSMPEGGFDKLGLKLVIDETFTPPLADAISVVQKVRNTRPDVLLLLPTSVPDHKLVLEKLSEMGLGRGRLPVVSNGAHGRAVMTVVANRGANGQEKLIAEFKKRTGEPWMTQDSISTYGDMWIFKEALEKAGAPDRKKVAQAIREIDTTDGPARYFPGGRLKFEHNGRRAGAALLIVQWQKGEPVVVYPSASAMAKPVWSKQ